MKKTNKKLIRFLTISVVPLLLIISMVLTGFQTKVQPENPLNTESTSSKMMPNAGKTIGLEGEYLANLGNADINKAEVSDENIDEDSLESNDKNDGKGDIGETSDNIGDSDKVNPNNPGDFQISSGDTTDTVYFTTTIKNGEVVYSRDYSFKINHKQENLRVKEERVYINNIQQPQFKGNVLLEEGKNEIKVSVTYVDKQGKKMTLYQDYVVYVDLGNLVIRSDLKNKTVETDTLDFTASATLQKKEVPVTVKCNGEELKSSSDNKYRAKLNEGENTIELFAESGGKSDKQTYTIQCRLPKDSKIETDLVNQTVNTDTFSFKAAIINFSSKGRLTVVCNKKTILPVAENEYTVPLNIGANIIRLKATDIVNGKLVTLAEASYVIKYVPIADEGTKPAIKHINVTDGMTITGNEFTLDLLPEDYKGNRIYSEGITVQLNGKVYKNTWQSEFTSYLLYLQGGANTLDIRIKDSDGRYNDYSYKINCKTVADGEKIGEITVSIDANVLGLGYIVAPVKVPIRQGETGSYFLTRFLEEKGFKYKHTGSLDIGFYLSRIMKPGIATGVSIPEDLRQAIDKDGLEWKEQRYDDSIGEFDYCQGSGWMYSVNGSFPGYGFSDVVFKDGDVVRIRFTLAYGKDIGGYKATGGQGQNYDKVW
ncbi:DUF4430 domain-containing protein [Clostridium cadaveris]|uniref:DUF4430 domain-containing protein n=1 Tax=Clostridium cadaveris TaxID=1529 RepID=UPI00399F81D6